MDHQLKQLFPPIDHGPGQQWWQVGTRQWFMISTTWSDYKYYNSNTQREERCWQLKIVNAAIYQHFTYHCVKTEPFRLIIRVRNNTFNQCYNSYNQYMKHCLIKLVLGQTWEYRENWTIQKFLNLICLATIKCFQLMKIWDIVIRYLYKEGSEWRLQTITAFFSEIQDVS